MSNRPAGSNAKEVSTKVKVLISLLLLVFIGVGSLPLSWGIQGVREARESSDWPTAQGKITKSEMKVTTSRTRDRNRGNQERVSHSYSADIEYEFVVDGVTRKGERITIVSDQFGSEAYASSILEKYPRDKAVTVSYKPGDPGDCVLEPGRWGGVGFQFAFAGAFILIPLFILRAIWNPTAVETDPHRHSLGERRMFGLEFRERFIEWDPGNIIHLHRDHLGFLATVGGALIVGLLAGLVFGRAPALWLFSGRGPLFVAQVYAAVSIVLAIAGCIWLGLEYRRRDSLIDWRRESFRGQVGWFAREFKFDDFQDLTLRVPPFKPRTRTSSSSGTPESRQAGRIFLRVGGRKYILLETEYDRSGYHTARSKMQSVIERLATDLKLPWVEA